MAGVLKSKAAHNRRQPRGSPTFLTDRINGLASWAFQTQHKYTKKIENKIPRLLGQGMNEAYWRIASMLTECNHPKDNHSPKIPAQTLGGYAHSLSMTSNRSPLMDLSTVPTTGYAGLGRYRGLLVLAHCKMKSSMRPLYGRRFIGEMYHVLSLSSAYAK